MHIPQNWRLKEQRYQLQGAQMHNNGVEFPPRPAVQQRVIERYNFAPVAEDQTLSEAMAS
jgi:hypothetical protein